MLKCICFYRGRVTHGDTVGGDFSVFSQSKSRFSAYSVTELCLEQRGIRTDGWTPSK